MDFTSGDRVACGAAVAALNGCEHGCQCIFKDSDPMIDPMIEGT